MIISKQYAQRLIKTGKAEHVTTLHQDQQGRVYVAINRLDKQRIDHYLDHQIR